MKVKISLSILCILVYVISKVYIFNFIDYVVVILFLGEFLWENYFFRIYYKLNKPNFLIEGQWDGVLTTKYEGKDIKKNIKIKIKQTYSNVDIRFEGLDSENSTSVSNNAKIFEENGQCYLNYFYETRSNILNQDKNRNHKGTCELEIINNKHLKGYYYTNRKTIGELEFTR